MRKLVTLILVAAVIAAGLVLFKKRSAELAQASAALVMPAVVSAVELKPQRVTLTLPAMGVAASDVSAVLSTRISGQVIAVPKREGQSVKEGEVLVRIDAKDLEAKKQGVSLQRQGMGFQVEAKKAEVSALETAVTTAREAHARTKELLDIKGASPEQYSQEEAEIAKLQASLTAARNSIETLQKGMETQAAAMREIDSTMRYSELTSPINGTVSQILARPGDLATPGKPLVRIASRAGLYLNISLPHGLGADEILLSGKASPLTCKDQAGETGLVQYVAPLPQNAGLVEGQFVNVDVVVYRGEGVLLPIDALLTMDGSSSVFVLTPDGKAQRLNVTVKARGVEGVTVDPDLAGRRVIVAKPDILLRVATGVPVVTRSL